MGSLTVMPDLPDEKYGIITVELSMVEGRFDVPKFEDKRLPRTDLGDANARSSNRGIETCRPFPRPPLGGIVATAVC